MEIETKDGIVLRSIPEGTPDEAIKARIAKIRAESASNPSEGGLPFRPFGLDTGLTMPQGVSRFMAGAGKGMTDVGRGIAQIAGVDNQGAIDEAKRLDKPLMDTGAGIAGNIGGNLAATAPAMLIPGVNTAAGGAVLGAGLGALQPVPTGESRGVNAAIGAVGGAAVPAVGAAYRTGKALVEPLYEGGRNTIAGRLLNRVAGENAPTVERRMALARELVPGSQPTAAEVAESGGVAAVQRMAAQADPEAYAQRGMEQATARLNALRGIAQDPAALGTAETARAATAKANYGAAYQLDGWIKTDRTLAKIAENPYFKDALPDALKLAEAKGVTLQDNPTQFLHFVKLSLDKAVGRTGDTALSRTEKEAVQSVRERLISWMGNKNPAYDAARQQFAADSRPINQMQVGQELLERIQPALADHGALGRETGARYAAALRNSEQTARTATGYGRNALEQVMEPGQMQTLNAVGQDLARKATSQDLGRGVGSNTFQNFAMENISQQSGMPAVTRFALNFPGASRAMNWVYRETDQRTRAQLAEALLEPHSAAMLMRQAQGNPQLVKALREIQRVGIAGGAATALPLANASQQ